MKGDDGQSTVKPLSEVTEPPVVPIVAEWKSWRWWLVPLVCVGLTTTLYTLAFAPYNRFESAFVFLTPFVAWSMFRPGLRRFAVAGLVASFLCWFFSMIWLVNLGDHLGGRGLGYVCLSFCSVIFGFGMWIWLLLMHRIVPLILDRPFWIRLLGILCLAGAWVLLEWARESILNVQWNTLSSSLWQQPVLLQLASVTGAWGLSFYLVFFNLGITIYIRHLVKRGYAKRSFFQRFCPEFYILFSVIGLMIWMFFHSLDKAREREPMFRAGVIQPDIPQSAKSDPLQTSRILGVLHEFMQDLRLDDIANPPELFLWPETATPVEALGNTRASEDVGKIVEQLVNTLKTPLLMGNMRADDVRVVLHPREGVEAAEMRPLNMDGVRLTGLGGGFSPHQAPPKIRTHSKSKEGKVTAEAKVRPDGTIDLSVSDNGKFLPGELAVIWFTALYNGIFYVEPDTGINEIFYAKQKLVPFGEFVPFGRYLPFLKKIVKVDEEFLSGASSVQIPVRVRAGDFKVGPLVCYEDVFSEIAREHAAQGADFLYVATNDGWYGTGGAAYQHAAHSVLRSVETRRPILRCGNNGWSGWINELGIIRQVLEHPVHGVYSQGRLALDVQRVRAFAGRQTFYVRHGDWFVVLSAVFVLAGLLLFRGHFRKQGQSAG
jgi:apolipoprotein N-acyltransferase